MRKKSSAYKKIVRANVINETSLREGHLPYVIASAKRACDKALRLSSYECQACSTNFTSTASTKPYCFNCGSNKVGASTLANGVGKVAPSKELTSVDCGGCGMHNIVADTLLPKMKGSQHCIHCGDEMLFDSDDTPMDVGEEFIPSDDGPGILDDPGVLDVTETEDLEDMTGGGLDEEFTEEAPVDEVFSEEDDDVEDDLGDNFEDVEGAGAEASGEDQQDDQADGQQDIQQDAADGAQDIDDDFGGDSVGQIQDVQDVDVMDQDIVANVLNMVKVPKGSKVELIAHGKRILAYVKGMPVASLTVAQAKAKDNEDVFYTEGFHKAIKHTASVIGVRKALASYGFKPICIKIRRSKIETAAVKSMVAKERAKYDAQRAKLKDDFVGALSVAAVGINKGFFKNKPNALKAAMFEELSTLNTRNPSAIVDKLFAQHGDQYNKVLIESAFELVGKSKEVFAALAETIGDTNYRAVKADTDEEDDQEDEVESGEEPDFENMGDSDDQLQQESNVTHLKTLRQNVASLQKLTGSATIFAKSISK